MTQYDANGNPIPDIGGGTIGFGSVVDSWNSISQGSTAGASSQQNSYYPWQVYTGRKPMVNNIRGSRGLRQQGVPAMSGYADGTMTGAEHMRMFWDNWNTNAKWRTNLITGAIAAGMAKPTSTAEDYLGVWENLGKYSARSMDTGAKMTPLQVLAFLAGKAGKNGLGQAQSLATDSTHTTYQIEDPATALAITQSVLTAALGRQATPDEVSRYKNAIQSYDRAHPQVTQTHDDGMGHSTSSTTGGVSVTGEQALVQSAAGNTAEGQAYQTNNVFDQAMKILAGL